MMHGFSIKQYNNILEPSIHIEAFGRHEYGLHACNYAGEQKDYTWISID